jgi:hypothetical protein
VRQEAKEDRLSRPIGSNDCGVLTYSDRQANVVQDAAAGFDHRRAGQFQYGFVHRNIVDRAGGMMEAGRQSALTWSGC